MLYRQLWDATSTRVLNLLFDWNRCTHSLLWGPWRTVGGWLSLSDLLIKALVGVVVKSPV